MQYGKMYLSLGVWDSYLGCIDNVKCATKHRTTSPAHHPRKVVARDRSFLDDGYQKLQSEDPKIGPEYVRVIGYAENDI